MTKAKSTAGQIAADAIRAQLGDRTAAQRVREAVPNTTRQTKLARAAGDVVRVVNAKVQNATGGK